MREPPDLAQDKEQLILRRKITRDLKHFYNTNINISKDKNYEFESELGDCENTLNQMGREAPLVARMETCQGYCDGITIHAVVAEGARDMSVVSAW